MISVKPGFNEAMIIRSISKHFHLAMSANCFARAKILINHLGRQERGIVAVSGVVYADKNHAKISRHYTAKKRWLRDLLSHARTRDSLHIQR